MTLILEHDLRIGDELTEFPGFSFEPDNYFWEERVNQLNCVLKGDRAALGSLMAWGDTPQGHDYWRKFYYGERELSKCLGELQSLLDVEVCPEEGWE